MGATIGDLTRILSDSGRNDELPLVWEAYEVSRSAHRGQRRANGDRYITHPVEVATIVAANGGMTPAVCAALLHDVIEDAGISSAQLHTGFGTDVATLVDNMTARTIRIPNTSDRDLMLLSVADRLHNLRTLGRLPAERRQRASLDTLVFHVPLARTLNAPTLAAEMTDLACTALASLDRRDARQRLGSLAESVRKMEPRTAVEAAAVFGGGAAVVGSEGVPEWALATGGAGMLLLVAAALFGRDPQATKRLADLIAAWRRGENS